MSTTEEDDKKEYTRVQSDTMAGETREVVVGGQPTATVVQVPAQSTPSTVKRETVAKRTTTNASVLVGMGVGVVVLAVGLLLALRVTPLLPYPFSTFGLILIAVALIAIGASLVSSRTSTSPT